MDGAHISQRGGSFTSGVGGVLHLTQNIGLSTSIGMPIETAVPGEKGYQLCIHLAASF